MKNFIIFLVFLVSCSRADSKVKIGVIDSDISVISKKYVCNKNYNFKPEFFDRKTMHGDNVVGLVMQDLETSKFCVQFEKFEDRYGISKNIIKLINSDVNVINISMEGPDFEEQELAAIKLAIKYKIKINVAAGNGAHIFDENNCKAYPACNYYYLTPKEREYFTVVTNDHHTSNVGSFSTTKIDGVKKGYAKMTGTSQSTAIYTNKMFRK